MRTDWASGSAGSGRCRGQQIPEKKIGQLLQSVVPSIIRCNQEEASALLRAEDEKEFLVLGTERQKIEGTAESCQQDGDAVFQESRVVE